jgi:segregation and condensation protein B
VNEDLSPDDPHAPETGDDFVASSAGETLPRDAASAPAEDAGEGSPETAPETLPAPEPEEEETAPTWVPEPDKLLCALLFASHEYLNARALREIMGDEWDTPRLRQLVKKINRDLESGEMAFEVVEVEGTFRIRTRPEYFPWTRKLFKDSTPRRLSQAALETLAIVAYKQPITKAEIESIRGVNVDGSLKTLLDKRLVDIGRRSDSLGQAFTYHTTRDFLRYFGINRMPDDLPRLSEFEGILNAQSLIPQMGTDGEVHEVVRPDEPEQLSLGMNPGAERED